MRKKIGECLIQAGLITEGDLRLALADHERSGERVGVVLVRLKLATETQIAKALAFQLGFPYLSLAENPPEPTAVVLIPKDVALKQICIAVTLERNLLTVAMADPLLFSLVQDLEVQTGQRIRQVVATRGDIVDAIEAAYPDGARVRESPAGSHLAVGVRGHQRGDSGAPAPGHGFDGGALVPVSTLERHSDAAPIIDLVDLVVKRAVASRASDVHVEPTDNGVLIRHRLDGLLKEMMDLPAWVHQGLIARLKTMAGMDLAETRLPQDGRLRARSEDGADVDFRVSTLRTLFGEKIVMRVQHHRTGVPALDDLGMSTAALETIRHLLHQPHGMLLVVGPNGSGKTTTLGAAALDVRSEKTNILTVEDPIEYQLRGVNQTQVNEAIGLTFASALRSVLHQDPDVILLADMHDAETATIAMQAAQRGRLVLASLHSDTAPSSVTQLTDMGTDPSVTAAALLGVVAQRLVRRLCIACRRQYTPPEDVLRALNLSEPEAAGPFYRAIGCDQCNHTGYRGRVGIYEVMRVTDSVRRLVASRSSADRIRAAAIDGGMVTLAEDGLARVKSGITTAEELLRVVTEVRETRALCGGCGSAVAAEFKACPQCGTRIGGGCPHCGRALQDGWQFCPYCARRTETKKSPRRLRDRDPGEIAKTRRALPRSGT